MNSTGFRVLILTSSNQLDVCVCMCVYMINHATMGISMGEHNGRLNESKIYTNHREFRIEVKWTLVY